MYNSHVSESIMVCGCYHYSLTATQEYHKDDYYDNWKFSRINIHKFPLIILNLRVWMGLRIS